MLHWTCSKFPWYTTDTSTELSHIWGIIVYPRRA
ncbi:hypothetical protein E1A91_D11G322300v1 [Gossypium mustelinum]|uniref:Uncharacterized protein n=1 Tax=Gossypium mustelinum TaxID=34275 RepID=A0A5D2SYJ2_GOSMU|nr:hypothetical protein E1A91_D11G322300v1 [Gossypium mustelinum]